MQTKERSYSITLKCKKHGPCTQLVSLWTDNEMGLCGWSCQNHRTTGRKHSLTDGRQERRSGRRSGWERHKSLPHRLVRESTISQGAKPRSPAKAQPGQMRGAACWLLLWRYRDPRWGGGEDHILALTARGWLWLRAMGKLWLTDSSTSGLVGKC